MKCCAYISLLLTALIASVVSATQANLNEQFLSKENLARSINSSAEQNRFPENVLIQADDGHDYLGKLEYTFDIPLHEKMSKLYLQYQPDYACFVAIDVATGAVINISSFIKEDYDYTNLVLRNAYPAASIIKIISAAAALDTGAVTKDTKIAFNGKSTTLYKRQVLHHKNNKWTRFYSLSHSFAKSINPVFARLGIEYVGNEKLLQYAERFGFNRSLQSDFILPPSKLRLDEEDVWSMAEVASGFNKETSLSPIHAAQIAAMIANDGKWVTPYMVQSVRASDGQLMYQAQQEKKPEQILTSNAVRQLQQMMQNTIKVGTARKSFRDIHKYKVYKDMQIGGKTGSLTGYSPRGRHDWFVGYAMKGDRRIAFASLIVNVEKWRVRSDYVARQFIYHYFSQFEDAN